MLFQTIEININAGHDPFPEYERTTKYSIIAGDCRECGEPGMLLICIDSKIMLICARCFNEIDINLNCDNYTCLTYIYWCNSSKFSEDFVELDNKDISELEKIFQQFSEENEIPKWAVKIINGICQKSDMCVCVKCIYNSQN